MEATDNKVKGINFFEDKAPKLMKMHLQFFADPPADPGAGDPPSEPPSDPPAFEAPKTQEDLDKLLQSNADKRVTAALATAQAKWEEEAKQREQNAKLEAEKLAGLSADEKQKLLDEKYKSDLEAREKALSQRELKIEAINILSEKKLPVSFADMLLSADAENTKTNIDTFEKAFREAVQEDVVERLKSPTPKGGGSSTSQPGEYGKQAAERVSKNQPDLQKAQQGYFN